MKDKKMPSAKHIIVLALSLAISLVLLIGATTLAAYTNSRHAQRTIATYETTGDRFSSNLLAKRNSRDNVKVLYVTDDSKNPNTIVTVCNYEQGKQTLPYEKNITYSLTARLVMFDNSTEEKYVPVDASYMTANSLTAYTVTITKGNTTVTLSSSHLSDSSFGRTLTGDTADSDAFTLSFGTLFAPNTPNLYVEMIALPTSNVLPTLRGVFKAEMRSEGASNSWTGSFSDDTALTPNQYDGFNYLITGVGSGSCTLTWNDEVVQLDFLCLSELLSIPEATQTESSVSFSVDSDENSRYDLRFYKVSELVGTTWSQMNSTVVTFHFTPGA